MTTSNVLERDFTEVSSDASTQSAGLGAVAMIEISRLYKEYQRGSTKIDVLRGLDLSIKRGRFEALMGPSGSGKTTLLNIVAGLDQATRGNVRVGGSDLTKLSDAQLTKWRSRQVGFIFQSFNLIPVLTALENVELPLLLTRLHKKERTRRAETALELVGMSDRKDHFPKQLSGGQEQRVAIARAIVSDPTLIVADEPTGDLDRESASEVLGLLGRLSREFDKTILMVTHDPLAAKQADFVHNMDKGAFV
ncbi:MAG TPA: ABC transporter ATP-binding protein [Polyangiaceae bacterium]|nr:ABC transporter ATP-binding protein [Polyangiaceae bacterium]